MNDQDRKDPKEFRTRYSALSTEGQIQTNNEKFNAMLNGCRDPRKVLAALAALHKKEAMS